jgi:cytochrome c5
MSQSHEQGNASGQALKLSILFTVAVVGLLAVIFVGSKSLKTTVANNEEAVAARIQKVGSVSIQAAAQAARTGEEVFKAQCSNCHGSGMLGAPKFGDAGAWGPRIAKGYDALLTSALKGKGNMGPQGGGQFADFEVGRGLAYMANAAGAKFAEPKDPNAK